MQLSKNFSLAEFEASELATRLSIPNRVPNEYRTNARLTCEMLQAVRDFMCDMIGVDVPINLTSGYRCLLLNRQLGSSDSSDHLQALAADWRAPKYGTPSEICKALAGRMEEFGIGQLINEFPDRNGWVHTSIKPPSRVINRIITITSAGTRAGVHTGVYG